MRIMQHFDEKIAAVLNEKVKARMNFKVGRSTSRKTALCEELGREPSEGGYRRQKPG